MLALIEAQVTPLRNEYDSGADYHGQEVVMNESEIEIVNEVANVDPNVVLEIVDQRDDFDREGNSRTEVATSLSRSNDSLNERQRENFIAVNQNDFDDCNFVEPEADVDSSPAIACQRRVLTAVHTNAKKRNENATSKFPSALKRKSNGDLQSFVLAKKARLQEKSSMEVDLAELKYQNFKKQSKLLDIQIQTAEIEKEAALVELEIKKKILSSIVV